MVFGLNVQLVLLFQIQWWLWYSTKGENCCVRCARWGWLGVGLVSHVMHRAWRSGWEWNTWPLSITATTLPFPAATLPGMECWDFLYLSTSLSMPLLTSLALLSQQSPSLCDWSLPRPGFLRLRIMEKCVECKRVSVWRDLWQYCVMSALTVITVTKLEHRTVDYC